MVLSAPLQVLFVMGRKTTAVYKRISDGVAYINHRFWGFSISMHKHTGIGLSNMLLLPASAATSDALTVTGMEINLAL